MPLPLKNRSSDVDAGVLGTAAPLGSVRGGEQTMFGAGVNWYLNSNVKLMLNYLHVDVDRLLRVAR